MISRVVLLSCLAATIAPGCSRQPATSAAGPPVTPAAAPARTPADMPAMQTSRTRAGTSAPRTVTGSIAEIMNAGNYTYMRVATGSEDLWVATSHIELKVGARVTVPLEMAMENFHSKALNRDFPVIYFVSHVTREGEIAAAVAPRGSPHAAVSAGAGNRAAVTEPMQPPPGGMTIASVWANRTSLVGKRVTIRGKVVKYNGAILGMNWLHIQDGTGAADGATNDLALTTTDTVRVGDVVTATGTVSIDKDFGAGYAYPVILERSTLKR